MKIIIQKKSFLLTAIAIFTTFINTAYGMEATKPSMAGKALSDISVTSAGVLPFFYHNGTKYALLGKERKDGTYGDFSGKAELGLDKDAQETAAREFFEEAGLERIFSSVDEVRSYIDNPQNTTQIFAYAYSAPHLKGQYDATFVTNMQNYYQSITKEFYVFRNEELAKPKEQQRADYLGKEAIAWCKYDDLAQAIKNSQYKVPAMVNLLVFDENGNSTEQKVELRPYFISKISVYFKHPEYCEQGADPRLLFLDWATVPKK